MQTGNVSAYAQDAQMGLPGYQGASAASEVKVTLSPEDLPKSWYNILPALPRPLPPPLNPATKEPIGPQDLAPLFAMELIRQEVSDQGRITIPEEVQEAYLRLGRPTPLYRAKRLEEYLKTPAKIYFKREDLSPTGSHKSNTAVAQAYYNLKQGTEKLVTETGAGQWGTALSLACSYFGMQCQVFMVRCSYDQKPYRRYAMQMFGGKVTASPSSDTNFGRQMLAKDPNHPGSLGIAISEAMESALTQKNTKYSLGSVLNHVLLHQTVIGLEAKMQFEALDLVPDHMVGCVGGGSNFGGFTLPMIGEKIRGKVDTEFLAVEPTEVPSLTKGAYDYDFGDSAKMTPLMKMYSLGCDFIPPPIYAGGLRYHGDSPLVSLLVNEKIVDAVAYNEQQAFEAARTFASTEGIIPAPETSHAIKAAIELALEAKKKNEAKVIAFNFSGHGLLDLGGYAKVL